MQLLNATRVCLVGTYTFYRFCRWANFTAERAIAGGIAYVPITPFEPPANPVSTLDPPAVIAERRRGLGIPADAVVIGRLARADASKWSELNFQLINILLERLPTAVWVSIGYPESLGRSQLLQRWGERFLDQPQTSDYRRLMDIVSSLDLQAFFGRGECFASSIAEASGAGVPTIGLATPLKDNGQAEQLIDGFNGYLVGSVEQAVERIASTVSAPEALAAMKARSRQHCWERWHMDRVAGDLLSLYQHWRSPSGAPPEYLALMKEEAEEFGNHYRDRMVTLLATNLAQRLKWQVLLAAAESPKLWPIGRAIKRLAEKLR
jgi:hypothetical protein